MGRRGHAKTASDISEGGLNFCRPLRIHFGSDLGKKLNTYAEQTGATTEQAVLFELILVALSMNPATALDYASRARAFNETKKWVIKRFYEATNSIFYEFRGDIEEKYAHDNREKK